jgi:hypothetical protein
LSGQAVGTEQEVNAMEQAQLTVPNPSVVGLFRFPIEPPTRPEQLLHESEMA